MDGSLPPILLLPPELVVLILVFLDIRDVIKIRQTCKPLAKITYEREIWMRFLQKQKAYLPLPRYLNAHQDEHLTEFVGSEVESVVIESEIISGLWIRPRSQPPYKLRRESTGSTLMGMKLLADRWLLVVYFEGAAYLYDTQPTMPRRGPTLRAALYLESGLWITHVVGMDKKEETIFLALSRSLSPHMVQIYEINLPPLSSHSLFVPNAFSLLKSIPLPLYKVIRAIDTEQHLVALSTSGFVEIVNWEECPDVPNTSVETHTIRVNTDDHDGLWDGIIAVHFLGDYTLIFRTRSVEAHRHRNLPSRQNSGAPMRQSFRMTFREVSFAQTTTHQHPASHTQTWETTLYAYDVIQGLFHYAVRVREPLDASAEASAGAALEVVLLGVYPLAGGLSLTKLYRPLPPPATSSAVSLPPTTFLANFTPVSSPLADRGEPSARGFLSAHAIGPQGFRGVWIERARTSTRREVHVWESAPPIDPPTDHDGVTAVEMPRCIVHTLQSFDLRDDITCCALGELSGTIVLGHRSGDISVLEVA